MRDNRYDYGFVIRTVLVVVGVVLLLYLIYLVRKPLLWVFVALFLAVALSQPGQLPAALDAARDGDRGGLPGADPRAGGDGRPDRPADRHADDEPGERPAELRADLQDFANKNPTLRKLERDYQITQQLEDQARALPSKAGDAAGLLQDAGLTIVNSVFAVVTILVLTAFMLGSGHIWVDKIISLQPEDRAKRMRRVAEHSSAAVGGYVGGVFLQATTAGILAYVVLSILDVPFEAPLALIIFLLDLVPLVGATIGAVIVGLITLFKDFPTATIIWAVWAIVYQQIENNVIQPRIQQRAVNVHPLGVLISVLFGAALLGVLGALVAIPVAATLQIVVREWWGWRADQQLEAEPGEATRLADHAQVSTGDDPEAEPPPPLPPTPRTDVDPPEHADPRRRAHAAGHHREGRASRRARGCASTTASPARTSWTSRSPSACVSRTRCSWSPTRGRPATARSTRRSPRSPGTSPARRRTWIERLAKAEPHKAGRGEPARPGRAARGAQQGPRDLQPLTRPRGDPEPEREVRARLRAALVEGGALDARTAALASLVSATELVGEVFPDREDRKAAKRRLRGAEGGRRELREALGAVNQAAVEAMLLAVTLMVSVTATTSAATIVNN